MFVASALSDSETDLNYEVGSDARWYVVQCQPHAEARAIFHLERQGYHVFCPRMKKTVRHARKAMDVAVPLFPQYLFLRLDPVRDSWHSVSGTRGVVRIVSAGNVPQPVPRGVVETLQADVISRAEGSAPHLKIGQAVRIAGGAFAEFVGVLEQFDDKGRVSILLDLLGRSVSVSLDSDGLAAVA